MGSCNYGKQQVIDPSLQKGKVQELKIVSLIWEKDYQGLFDYDTDKIQKKSMTINKDGILLKDQKKLIFICKDLNNIHKQQQTNNLTLLHLIKKLNYYKISPVYQNNQICQPDKLIWLVVRSVPQKSCKISQRDIIKLGKQKLRIRETVPADNNMSDNIDFNQIEVSKILYNTLSCHPQIKQEKKQIPISQNDTIKSVVTYPEQTCKICLQYGQISNPLIAPCKCSGSIKYIHLRCLRNWLSRRLKIIRTKHCITIHWEPLTCEMCKVLYKYRIYLDNKKFYTVQIPKPAKPYLVLEVIKKNSGEGKVYHFISLANKNSVNLGRKKQIDVKISDDISISRNHASIFYKPQTKEFFLEDNGSKFGTLLLVKHNILARPHQKGIMIQIGAQVYTFQAIREVKKQIFKEYNNTEIEYLNVDDESENLSADEEQDEEDEVEENEQNGDVIGNMPEVALNSPDFSRRATSIT